MSFIRAIEAGCDEDALQLLAEESSPIAGEILGEAFLAAIAAGSTKVTERLLDLGADPNTRWPRDPNPPALSLAMDHAHESMHLLISRTTREAPFWGGSLVDVDKITPLDRRSGFED
ncbi:MAG: hypothetical protein QNK04_27670 [Myxococcota bacterium]|nr:hypothetical protein [Myxococcota bacterium]